MHLRMWSQVVLPLLLLQSLHWTNSQSTHSLIPEALGRLEVTQFQLELDNFVREQQQEQNQDSNSRVKRTVLLNAAAAIDVALIFGIPITTVLPVLANVFTNLNWSKIFKFKRSVSDEPITEIEFVEESSIVQPHLDKLRGYFELMKISEPSCQERVICELSADPSKYFPVSELVLSTIRNSPTPPSLSDHDHAHTKQNQSLFAAYTEAADKGLTYGDGACTVNDEDTHMSRRCPDSLEERLDMNALQYWQYLSSMLGFRIRDTPTYRF